MNMTRTITRTITVTGNGERRESTVRRWHAPVPEAELAERCQMRRVHSPGANQRGELLPREISFIRFG